MDVTALVLAAGSSRRMGSPKALVEREGETFLARAVRVLLEGGATRALVVVGGPHRVPTEAAARELAARGLAVSPVENPDPAEGPVTSVRAGLRAMPPGSDAALIHPVDIPGVEPEDVAALLEAAEEHPEADAVVPSVDMRRGHPLLLRRAAAERLLAPEAPRTVRELLRAEGVRVHHVVRENRGLLRDYDSPGELEDHRTRE